MSYQQPKNDLLPEPPAESHYRQAEPDGDQACAVCTFFAAAPSENADGSCRFWDANVMSDYVCDDFEATADDEPPGLFSEAPVAERSWAPEPEPVSALQKAQAARRRRVA